MKPTMTADRRGMYPRDRLEWSRDGRDWPHHDASRFVEAGGLRWHVQRFGPAAAVQAPIVLLLHGTGAATHSWRGLAPRLATAFEVIAPDLPGHGFTAMPSERSLSLSGMAEAVSSLVLALEKRPVLIVGHSAGAAIGARICLDGNGTPRGLVALNGAFLPLGGLPGRVFSPAAQLLAATGLAPRLFARLAAGPTVVDRLLRGTGSSIDAAGQRAYATLVRSPGHVAAALGMMARWDLGPLEHALPRLDAALLLLAGERDLTVPPAQSARIAGCVPGAVLDILPGLGHLAHEERPDLVADRIIAFAARLGMVDDR
jgi:magnesium chelatase accessory protein